MREYAENRKTVSALNDEDEKITNINNVCSFFSIVTVQ